MGKRTGRLCFRETPIAPGAVPRAGGWVARGCRSCRRLAGLCGQDARAPRTSLPGPCLGRGGGWLGGVAPVGALRAFGPLRARCPRSQDIAPGAVPRAGGWVARGCRSCRRLAGLRPVAGKMPALPGHRSRGRASGGGVGGSGVSLLSAPCGPSARCGQDARAPRTSLPGPCLGRGSGWLGGVAPVGALRAFGPVRARCPRSQDIAPGAVPRAGEWVARGCRSCRRFAGLRPVAGKMPALPGHRSRGRASGGGAGGSGVSLLSAPCGPSARPLRARCPRSQDIAPGAVPRAGVWVARGCRSCRRLAGLRPGAGKMPALPGHRSRAVPRAGCGWLGGVAPVGALRAFGPLRARCPRSQDIAPGAVPRVGEWNVSDRLRADRQCNQTHIELTRPSASRR